MPGNKVVYLTGAPASGKSSVSRALRAYVERLAVFEYGARLTAYVNQKGGRNLIQSTIREQSSAVVTPEDVAVVDRHLIQFVRDERAANHVVIDSHAVTKESYGFRVTPYSLKDLATLSPTHIWVLYTEPHVALDRIARDAQGRPSITEEEARFHTSLQASVAVTYGIGLGIPVYFFDSNRPLDELTTELASRLAK
jgi:adenylate kinase